ncbi:NfeD family protein [Geoalkalibacter subterraneus]|uniref:NfeD-like C-terminal domain-containing protein n=1 Tax=Geoalkalibacter subterraneus TaxID=483547 RepID=A0A0B5FLE8_9BACT|nr:NfeD family protein [Geoalkalibacter subterraneus]AJF08243.1 hypothetical protein GSUB_17310 [Geoalkalibacter subterraneus]
MNDSLISAWVIWFAAGIGLAFLELVAPGFILIFFAAGCLLTSIVLWIWQPELSTQMVIFLTFSLSSLFLLRGKMTKIFRGESHQDADLGAGDNPKGEIVTAVTPIGPNLKGRIRYRGTDWYAVSDQDIETGTLVEILGYEKSSKQIFRVKVAQSKSNQGD